MNSNNRTLTKKLIYVFLFSIAFALVESSVVVYLRVIYYPQGFHFPIKQHYDYMLVVEIIREFATIIMMVTLSALLCKPVLSNKDAVSNGINIERNKRKFWEGLGYFLIIFGIWDIFFYLWLKVILNWPDSFLTPDILFLIPVPWIGPVLAPVLISLTMIIVGIDIVNIFDKNLHVQPKLTHWLLVLTGSALILYSFMSDVDAGFHEQYPKPYSWILLILGLLFYFIAHTHLRKSAYKNH